MIRIRATAMTAKKAIIKHFLFFATVSGSKKSKLKGFRRDLLWVEVQAVQCVVSHPDFHHQSEEAAVQNQLYIICCPLLFCQTRVQIQAASADTAGKMTSSFSSWLLILKPYFLPTITLSASG